MPASRGCLRARRILQQAIDERDGLRDGRGAKAFHRNVDLEVLLEAKHEIDRVERIDAKFAQARGRHDLGGILAEILDELAHHRENFFIAVHGHLRSLKTDMHMEMLRTKTPDMARKEIATHFLAYNLIRGIMAEAARTEKVKPRELSFKGALHTIRSFEETHLYNAARIVADLPRLLELIGKKRVGDRPNRYEPRAVKRRPKPHPLLNMTRAEAKRLIRMGVIPYAKA